MFDLGKIECTTALEVELLAALVYERRLRSRREQPPKPQPDKPPTRLTFLPPPREYDFSGPACDATAKEIQAATAKQFKLTVNDLLSQRRNHYLCLARHAAVILCHELTLHSYPQLAKVFGRDHTTMLHSVTKFRDLQLELVAELNKQAPLTDWTLACKQKITGTRYDRRLPQKHESVA